MAMASFVVPNVLGGEISQFAQGRFDKPDYRTSLNVCLNGFPLEAGPWTRRPGTRHAGTTLGGAPGRVVRFDFEQAQPYTLELTDGKMRFRSGPNLVSGTLNTPYINGTWSSVRAVQAETTDILLQPAIAPQALTVTTLPAGTTPAVFALNPAIFNDGPYLDSLINGVQAVPSALSGIVTLALQFPLYSVTKAYAQGAFVTSVGICYVSLVDQNVGHVPAASPTFWQVTSAGAAINNGRGFLGSDFGRLVRLLSEPAAWDPAVTYAASTAAAPVVVSYNPSGAPGASTYWSSLVASNTNHAPGADLLNWQIVPQGAAVWTWGKIIGFTNAIDPALAGSVNFGNMTGGGGLAAAFNGIFSQSANDCAEFSVGPISVPFPGVAAGTIFTLATYVGKDYSGSGQQVIEHATIYPSYDQGFGSGNYTTGFGGGSTNNFAAFFTLNLRAKQTAPVSESDGVLLGTSGQFANTASPVTINSNDVTTAWKYVWIEQIGQFQIGGASPATAYFYFNVVGEVSFFNPTGTGTGAGVTVEILGPPLLRITPILTWRLGAYSNTTGWPTCGVYYEGRIWLGGAIANRFDGCVSNGILGGTINFAPTDQFGVVATSAALNYTLNSKSVNPMFWMQGDLQGIKIGTQEGEWLVSAPTAGPLAANNITGRQVSHHGSENIEPIQTEHTMGFVKRFGRKLVEYFADANFNKLSGTNLAEKAEHVITSGIAEIAYTSAVNPVIWGRCNDDSWFGVTYKRDTLTTAAPPTFAGWHRHTLGSGRVVESICGGPSVGGDLDALTMVTNDSATGIRHVEILTDTPNELSPLAAAWFLDDAVSPTSTVSSAVPIPTIAPYGGLTINGLPYANGATVQVFAGGLDCGDVGDNNPAFRDFVVNSGSIFIPYGDGVSAGTGAGLFTGAFVAALPPSQIVVGYTFTSRGQLVRPVAQADSGARNGPAFGKLRRIHRMAAQVVNTLGLWVGTDFAKLVPAPFKQKNLKSIPPLTMYSGLFDVPPFDDDGYDGMLCWEIRRPFPATIVAIGGNIDTKDQ